MKSVRGFGIVVFAFVFAFVIVSCKQVQSESLEVTDIWSRPATTGTTSVMYFVINNPTNQDDYLIRAETDAAETAELHLSSMDANGNMIMQPQEKVAVPTGKKVEFKPGSFHVMLINLKTDLKAGQKFNATLTFEKAGKLDIEVTVREL